MHPQHIVAAGCLVTNEAGLILLVRSPKRGWEFPGGQVEEGESIDAAVIREVHEETGLRCAVDRLASVTTSLSKPPKVIFDFLGHFLEGKLRTSPESLEVGWFSEEQARALIFHEGYLDRFEILMGFEGTVQYRTCTYAPYRIVQQRAW